MRIRKVQVWIYDVEKKDLVLLLQTNPRRGGFWQPVTGGVEEGEDWVAGALREVEEETGFQGLSREMFVDLDYEFEFDGQWGPAVERCFGVGLPPGVNRVPQVDPEEHQAWQWVSIEKAFETVRYKSNSDGLSRLKRLLGCQPR